MEPLEGADDDDDGELLSDGGAEQSGVTRSYCGSGAVVARRLPQRYDALGSLQDWWSAEGGGGGGAVQRGTAVQREAVQSQQQWREPGAAVPWAAMFDLAAVPYLVDTELLVKQRQLQVGYLCELLARAYLRTRLTRSCWSSSGSYRRGYMGGAYLVRLDGAAGRFHSQSSYACTHLSSSPTYPSPHPLLCPHFPLLIPSVLPPPPQLQQLHSEDAVLAALAGGTGGTACGTSGTATNGCSAASIGPLGAHAGSGAVLAAAAAAATSAAQTTLHQVRGEGGRGNSN